MAASPSEPVPVPCKPESLFHSISGLSNGELTLRLEQLNQRKQVLDAELLLHLSLFEQRGLYRNLESSLFTYCVKRLGFSEDVAYKRVAVARMLRRFPPIFELLAQGKIHLSALLLLKPLLNEENHAELLRAASGLSKRAVELLVATRAPRPCFPTKVRKLPEPRLALPEVPEDVPLSPTTTQPAVGTPSAPMATLLASATQSAPAATLPPAAPVSQQATATSPVFAPSAGSCTPQSEFPAQRLAPPSPCRGSSRAALTRIEPLSSCTYRVAFTASDRLKQKLDRASELASHAVSPSDLPGLLERALDLLIEREQKRRFASGGSEHPRSRASQVPRKDDQEQSSCTQLELDRGGLSQEKERFGERCGTEPMAPGRNNTQPMAPGRNNTQPMAPGRNNTQPMAPGRVGTMPMERRTRYIPAQVRRAVWERDQGCCAFVDAEGQRCSERHFVQFEHREPYALNGPPTVDNCELLCATHNALRAEQAFGQAMIAGKIAARMARTQAPR